MKLAATRLTSSPGMRSAFRAPAPLRWWTQLASRYRHFEFSAGIVLFCLVYYLAFHSNTPTSPSPLWIADSILLCTLLRAPPRSWWVFLALIVPIRLAGSISDSAPLWYLLGTTAVDAAKGVAGALAVRFVTPDPSGLSSWRDWLAMGALLVIAALSAFPGAALGQALGDDYWHAWQLWFSADVLAQLVITPALLTWLFWKGAPEATTASKIEAVLLFPGLAVTSYLAFSSSSHLLNFVDSRFFLPIPFLYWAALRFGMAGAAIAVPLISFFALNSALLQESMGLLQRTIFFDPHPADAPAFVLSRFLLFRTLPVYVVAGLVERRHRAERLMRESEARFRLMANTAPVLVWMSGIDKGCTFCNQVMLDFIGEKLETQLGTGWIRGVHPDDLACSLESYETAFDARRPFRMEYRLRNRDRQYRWVVIVGVPRFDLDASFLGYIGTALDITDQKQVQEDIARIGHLQRLAHMGELTASIAHELRQPLSGILLHAETLRRLLQAAGASSPQFEEILSDIDQDGRRAADVLVTIRELVQKREEGEERFEPVDVNGLVLGCQSLISNEAVRRRVRIATELAPDLPLVNGAPTEITQVFLNLLFNAMDAMEETPAASRCVTLRTQRRGDGVQVSVLDQGHGIKPEDRPKLFESFFTTRPRGMGLGLSIVQSILQVHHGRVWAENLEGGGAAFHFTLPAYQTAIG